MFNLREESSRFISSLLMKALEDCQQGDMEIAGRIGLSIETMQKLDRLRADQIFSLSGTYVRDLTGLEVLCINAEKMTNIIERASEETRQNEMVDEFLRRGACKNMMLELFGMRSTQVACRKKFLNIPTVKGRLPISTLAEQRQIYDAWLKSLTIVGYREKLLNVARLTDIALSKVFREVQEVETIRNNQSAQKPIRVHAYA